MQRSADQVDREPKSQSGFVLSLGFVLVLTILVIGLAVGIAAVRNAWFQKLAVENSQDVYVIDENNQVLGKAVDFDEHEAPLVPFFDYDAPDGINRRALVGIRDDRFTSRERVYYSDSNNLNCTGQACIFVPSTEISGPNTTNSIGIDEIQGTGGVSYQIATQAGGGPGSQYNYGIGSTDGGLPGRLYRQTGNDCQVQLQDPAPTFISYWQSQRVVDTGGTDSGPGTNPPCYQVLFNEPAQDLGEPTKCQDPYGGSNCCDAISCKQFVPPGPLPADLCQQGVQTGTKGGQPVYACDCPPGWSDLSGNNSGICCPPGTDPDASTPASCTVAGQNYLPDAGSFLEAEEVLHPTTGDNVLDGLGGSFSVSLPIDPDSFVTAPPDGE